MEKWTRLLVILAATLLLFVFAALLVALGMRIHRTLLLFSLGILVAYALDPLVNALGHTGAGRGKRPLSRELRVSLVCGGLVLLLGAAVWSLGGHLAAQVAHVQEDLPRYSAQAETMAGRLDSTLAARGISFSVLDALRDPPAQAREFLAHLGQHALPFFGHLLADVGESIIVLLIALYFLIYGHEIRERMNHSLHARLRPHVLLWEQDVDRIIGSFVRGQLLIALAMGGATAVVCLLIGIRTWLLIGGFVTVTALIPVFGPFLGALPAVAAAIIGPTRFGNPVAAAIVVVVAFTIIAEIGSKVLYPRLVGEALGLHAVLVLFVLLAGLEIGGMAGVLFAAPVTALALVTAVHLYRFWLDLPDDLLTQRTLRPIPADPAPLPLTTDH